MSERDDNRHELTRAILRIAIGEGLALAAFVGWWLVWSDQDITTLIIGVLTISVFTALVFLLPVIGKMSVAGRNDP